MTVKIHMSLGVWLTFVDLPVATGKDWDNLIDFLVKHQVIQSWEYPGDPTKKADWLKLDSEAFFDVFGQVRDYAIQVRLKKKPSEPESL